MEIQLGKGIGKLKFGMSQSDVESILGKPDRIQMEAENDNNLIADYNEIKIRVTYYKDEDNKFSFIRSKNKNLTYNGFPIIDVNLNKLKNEIFNQNIDNWEIEEYGSFTSHFNEEFWLTLDEEYGVVVGLELGVPFKEDGNYDWPE